MLPRREIRRGAAAPVSGLGAGPGLIVSGSFQLSDADFDWLRRAASQHSGIMLPEGKRTMIYSRLAKRLRVLGMKKFSEYRKLLDQGDQAEFAQFINALTTNLTAFFREPYHFDNLCQEVLPALLLQRRSGRRVALWSAGCSTGEEPYSLSMAVCSALQELGGGWDYRIRATDLDTTVLATAANGIYDAARVEGLEEAALRRWFLRGAGSFRGKVRVKRELQAPIRFEQLNLVKEWSVSEPLDVIFCRNVVIYFDKLTQKLLFDRFANALNPGGYLYIGHSESLFQVTDRFALVGKTTYQKVF